MSGKKIGKKSQFPDLDEHSEFPSSSMSSYKDGGHLVISDIGHKNNAPEQDANAGEVDQESLFRAKIKAEDLAVSDLMQEFEQKFQKVSSGEGVELNEVVEDLVSFQSLLNNFFGLANEEMSEELMDKLVADVAATVLEVLGVKPGEALYSELMGMLASIGEEKKNKLTSLLEFVRLKLLRGKEEDSMRMHQELMDALSADLSSDELLNFYGKLLRLGDNYGLELLKADNTRTTDMNSKLDSPQVSQSAMLQIISICMQMRLANQYVEAANLVKVHQANSPVVNPLELQNSRISSPSSSPKRDMSTPIAAGYVYSDVKPSYYTVCGLTKFTELVSVTSVNDRGLFSVLHELNRSGTPGLTHSRNLHHQSLEILDRRSLNLVLSAYQNRDFVQHRGAEGSLRIHFQQDLQNPLLSVAGIVRDKVLLLGNKIKSFFLPSVEVVPGVVSLLMNSSRRHAEVAAESQRGSFKSGGCAPSLSSYSVECSFLQGYVRGLVSRQEATVVRNIPASGPCLVLHSSSCTQQVSFNVAVNPRVVEVDISSADRSRQYLECARGSVQRERVQRTQTDFFVERADVPGLSMVAISARSIERSVSSEVGRNSGGGKIISR